MNKADYDDIMKWILNAERNHNIFFKPWWMHDCCSSGKETDSSLKFMTDKLSWQSSVSPWIAEELQTWCPSATYCLLCVFFNVQAVQISVTAAGPNYWTNQLLSAIDDSLLRSWYYKLWYRRRIWCLLTWYHCSLHPNRHGHPKWTP